MMGNKPHVVFMTIKEIDSINKVLGFFLDTPEGKPFLDDYFSHPPSLEDLKNAAEKLEKKATELYAEENG